MPDFPVTSRSTDATVDFTVSAPFDGDGVAVDYYEESISVLLHNRSEARSYGERDALYRVDSGEWMRLAPGAKQSVAVDMATQTLTMKLAQFAAAASIRMIAAGPASGLYVGDDELESGGVDPEALAALGVYPSSVRETDWLTFTNAQFKALPSTPLDILAVPDGSLVAVNRAILVIDARAGEYTNLGAASGGLTNLWLSGGIPNMYFCDSGEISNTIALPTITVFYGSLRHKAVLAGNTDAVNGVYEVGEVIPRQAWYSSASTTLDPIILSAENYTAEYGASLGDFTGGHASNSVKVKLYYELIAL
jgi:hypothetical protein